MTAILAWLESLLPRIAVNLLARVFSDWRHDGNQRDLGAAQQSNKEAVELEKRGRESDEIERRVETASDEELDRILEGKK